MQPKKLVFVLLSAVLLLISSAHMVRAQPPDPTWEVQSDYFGERNAIGQPRTIRSVALSHDGLSVYTGNIQSPNAPGTTSLRKVSSAILAVAGTDHVIFGNGMPGGTGGFGQVGGQPVYAGGTTGTFHAWRDVGNSPEGIATDDRGYVYVALESGIGNANAVAIFNADLSVQEVLISTPSPTGVAIHKIGSTYYAYTASSSGTLKRWDVTNVAAPVLDSTWNPAVLNTRNLTVDADGTVFAVDAHAVNGRVYRISADGTTSSFVSVPRAAGVAVYEDKLYVIKRQSPTQPIVVLNKADLTSAGPDLVVPAFGDPSGSLSQFTSIDVSADGRLYVSEENYKALEASGSSYTPPVTSFNPTPGPITGRIYFDRVLVSSVVAQPPVAVDDAATVAEDASATPIDVLANDTDVDGGPKTIASASDPANGTVVIAGDGLSLTYQPDANTCNDGLPTDNFTYTLNRGSTADVAVTVTCVDDAPLAVNDAATVAEDAAATTIDVLANDTDIIDGGPKTITSATDPANGTVAVAVDGLTLAYQPDANYCNDGTTTDDFTYTLNGGSTATVAVTVTCADDAPLAVNDAATVAEDAAATLIDVLANDTDVDNGPKTITSASDPANGTVVVAVDGLSLTYQPDANYCNDGSPADNFSYTLSGGSTATVAVTVTCADDAPGAVDDVATVAEDAAATSISVLANDTDIDGGPKTITSATDPANGTVVVAGDSLSLTYQPDANTCNNGSPTDNFSYTLNGGSTATVAVTVTCVDDAPVAVNNSATVAEDAAATTIDVLANDTDVDGGPKTIASASDPVNGTVVVAGNGLSLTYQPDAGYCNDGSPTDDFTYTLNGGSTATVAVTVTCADIEPLILISSNTNGNVPNLSYRDEDIILWDPASQKWFMFFDGSDVGLGNVDVDAFAIYNGKILLSLDSDFKISGFGEVDDTDIIAFTPLGLGNQTTGSYARFLDGSDVGLNNSGEDIDAIDFDIDGKLIISVNGSFSAPGFPSGTASGNDEDLFVLHNGVFGSNTNGKWSLYFDGSDVGLTSSDEDLQALWADHAQQKLYFATVDNYSVPGLSGNEDDIILCTYTSLGSTTACTFTRYWDGKAHGFKDDAIDGLQLVAMPAAVSSAAASSAATPTQVSDVEIDLMAIVGVPQINGDLELDETEPTAEAPGDDTTEFSGDDADQLDEPDSTEEAAQDNRLFVPSIVR